MFSIITQVTSNISKTVFNALNLNDRKKKVIPNLFCFITKVLYILPREYTFAAGNTTPLVN